MASESFPSSLFRFCVLLFFLSACINIVYCSSGMLENYSQIFLLMPYIPKSYIFQIYIFCSIITIFLLET